MMKRWMVWGALICMSVVSYAQSDTVRVLSLREIYRQNIWLSGDNPVGLAFNSFGSFSVAEAGYCYEEGNNGNVSFPVSANKYALSVNSFQTIGKVNLYGGLEYRQSRDRGQNWKGMVNDYWQAANLCDSVTGKRHNEMYHLSGAFSLPLRSHWLIGAKADFRAQTVAKDSDPRNKNEWSEWLLAPGIGYQMDKCAWGISLSYANKKETVDYQNMGAQRTYPYFVAYPLGFYNTLSGDEAIKWYYNAHEAGGTLQLAVDWQRYRLFLEVGGKLSKQDVESSPVYDYKEAESTVRQINYKGRLQKLLEGRRDEWSCFLSYQYADNYEPVQQQEESGVWKSYGKVLRSTRKSIACGVSYEYVRFDEMGHPSLSVVSGVGYQYKKETLKFYPIEFLQPLHQYALQTQFLRRISLPAAYLDYSVLVRYSIGNGTKLEERNFSSGQESQGLKLWQNTERLQQIYEDMTASRCGVNVTLTYTRKAPLCWFIRCSGLYEYSAKCRVSENNRKIYMGIGLNF